MSLSLRGVMATVLALPFALAGTAAQAQSQIVNIAAISSNPADAPNYAPSLVSRSFAAGTYAVSWLDNTSAYGFNGWTFNTGASRYREAFTASYDGNLYVFDTPGPSHYNGYKTPQEALDAFNGSAGYAVSTNPLSSPVDFHGNQVAPFATVAGPLTFTFAAATTVVFGVPDFLFRDNGGGVSIKLTQVSPVPEPSTYALMLAGLAVTGFVARRRRRDA